jgi:hypothetical protein
LAVIQVLDQKAGAVSHGRSGGALSANSAGDKVDKSRVRFASTGQTSANRKSSPFDQRRAAATAGSVVESYDHPVASFAGLANCRRSGSVSKKPGSAAPATLRQRPFEIGNPEPKARQHAMSHRRG